MSATRERGASRGRAVVCRSQLGDRWQRARTGDYYETSDGSTGDGGETGNTRGTTDTRARTCTCATRQGRGHACALTRARQTRAFTCENRTKTTRGSAHHQARPRRPDGRRPGILTAPADAAGLRAARWPMNERQ
jgi:hypothetical protein